MSSTDEVSSAAADASVARCTNPVDCSKAAARETLDWYPGAGEYCPECGEALVRIDAPAHGASRELVGKSRNGTPVADSAASGGGAATEVAPATNGAPANGKASSSNGESSAATATTTATIAPLEAIPDSTAGLSQLQRRPPPPRRPARRKPLSGSLIVAAVICAVAIAVFTYFGRPAQVSEPGRPVAISVCPLTGAQQFVSDLVDAYSAKSGIGSERFAVRRAKTCDVRFTTVSSSPDDVIARDGIVAIVNPLNPITRISEQQLRLIYSGAIRDWSQVGGAPGPIFAVMPNDASDESRAVASSLFYGLNLDRGLERPATSAEVTRIVAGADRRGRSAIGLVAFSTAVPAKVIPLAYLPPPSPLTIASGRYPYRLNIGIETDTGRVDPAASGLIEFAHSSAGAEIVAKNGLVGREGI